MLSLPVVLALIDVRPAAAAPISPKVTYPLQFHAFCGSGSAVCGYGSEDEYRRIVLEKLDQANKIWAPVGVSFRPAEPAPVEFHYDTDWELMTFKEGPSLHPSKTNEDLKEEAKKDFAVPEEISVFMMPMITNVCWSSFTGNGNTSVFCHNNWGGDGGQVFAHELGHLLGLPHPFTGQDPATHSPVDHDGDDLSGTPDDPHLIEVGDEDGHDLAEGETDVKLDHDWCQPTLQSAADPGSPKDSWCTVECRTGTGTGPGDLNGFAPDTANIMAYYGGTGFWGGLDQLAVTGCFGPYVLNGVRAEPFSQDQIDTIGDTVADVAGFDEVCDAMGGDEDRDGICDQEDRCPYHPETYLDWLTAGLLFLPADLDDDGDVIPDHCDLCPDDPTPTGDLDGDGLGDVCDDDLDGDGCENDDDEDPESSVDVVGAYVGNDCGGKIEAFAGGDVDDDGLLNCEDPNDDDDKYDDVDDDCIAEEGLGCFEPCSSPVQHWWFTCKGHGGCVELLLKATARINPDPTLFTDIQVVEDTIYAAPLAGRTMSESIQALLANQRSWVSLALVDERGNETPIVAFDARSATLLDMYEGQFVAIRVDARGAVTVSTADAIGAPMNPASRRPGVLAPAAPDFTPTALQACEEE